jgi:hypothetical protein
MKIEQLRNNQPNTSVVVHVNELLDERHRKSVESVVERAEGVTNAQFNETRHHLMIVAYDPKRISSEAILGRVMRHNLHAQLI